MTPIHLGISMNDAFVFAAGWRVTPVHLGISTNDTIAFEAGWRVVAGLVERPAWRPQP